MRVLLACYTLTLFMSAFLLFSVQPLVGKFLLPLLGGGPSIWNTAMVFFQLLLLGGYAYAHTMSRYLKPQTQYYVHIALFFMGMISLPLSLPGNADPTNQNPFVWQLTTMILMAAGPFFILSSTAPLLQQWFTKTSHNKAQNPYFLYVASNLGSMLALLSYPTVIEPFLRLHDQSIVWSWGYALLAVMLIACGFFSKFSRIQPSNEDKHDSVDQKITWKQRSRWLLLAFVPSSLMIGVTTFITTDITTVPLLWVMPLSLYLLSFIIAFSEKPFLNIQTSRIIHAVASLFILFLLLINSGMAVWNIALFHLFFFFFSALVCHQELAELKPKARDLTEFYLVVSVGGALGGIFNSLLAPVIFDVPHEYLIVILLAVFCRYLSDPARNDIRTALLPISWKIYLAISLALITAYARNNTVDIIFSIAMVAICMSYFDKKWTFGLLFIFAITFNTFVNLLSGAKPLITARNYYGIILVSDIGPVRIMTHGVTDHGGQLLDPQKRFEPIGYFGKYSGLADLYKTDFMTEKTKREIAILGLGTGSVACFYNGPLRHFDYFEIDPNVVKIAEDPKYFTFLSDCKVDYSMHIGDGRLLIKNMPDKKYDLIHMDAFTSDNIPVHLLTMDAIQIYVKKLKEDGVLLFHVSNRFFTLETELAAIARALDIPVIHKQHVLKNKPTVYSPASSSDDSPSHYVVMTKNQKVLDELRRIDPEWTEIKQPIPSHPWTDDFSNILRALILR